MGLVRRCHIWSLGTMKERCSTGCAREIVLGAALTPSDALRLGVCDPSCTFHKFISHPTNSVKSHFAYHELPDFVLDWSLGSVNACSRLNLPSSNPGEPCLRAEIYSQAFPYLNIHWSFAL